MSVRSRIAPRAQPRRAPARTLPAPRRADGAGPIVKWVGGKSKLLPELLARMPARFGRYFEPFAGGAALFFRLAPRAAVLSDFNPDLIATYRAVAHDVDAVIARLAIHARKHNEKHYYGIRDQWNDRSISWSVADRAAAFLYLNKTCYNGLWRVNKGGGFNVPMGRYTDPPICTPDALRAASRALAVAELRTGDYAAAVTDARAGDLVYFDPPYHPVTETANFVSYTGDGFGPEQQRALARLAHDLVARGCRVVLSNSDTPFTRELYADLRVDRVWCARAVNSDASKRGDVAEVIAMGGF